MSETKLPEEYLDRMKELLGEEGYEEYLASFLKDRFYGMRINTSKISPEVFLELSHMELSRISWIPNGFTYPGANRPAKDPYYYAGLYYLQEPSAMTPAHLLPIVPGDRVLDLCAAPGGKSTELGIRLNGQGMLVSNDISNSRARALLKNLELWGIAELCVTSEEPSKLLKAFGEFFDKILIDAPCSGEGMFRKDSDMVKSYEEHGPLYYAAIQKTIVDEAVRMLLPGGMMLYSTCTFSVCEDEDIIRYILSRHEDMELVNLEPFEGACDGIGLTGCIRLFPHKIDGEGHFIALLQKKKRREEASIPPIGKPASVEKLPEELKAFLKLIHKSYDETRFMIKNDMVYYLPAPFKRELNLRFLRTGLWMGEVKKGRFEPGQALAMTLKPEEFETVISWSREDERVIRYLKGETISLTEAEGPYKGWCLICVDQFPLGFAKGNGMTLKNKYYPGWRWQ